MYICTHARIFKLDTKTATDTAKETAAAAVPATERQRQRGSDGETAITAVAVAVPAAERRRQRHARKRVNTA